MIRRVLLVATAGVAIAGLVSLSDPHSVPQPEPSPIVGPSDSAERAGSVWFCPIGSAGIGDPNDGGIAAPSNHVDVAAVDDVDVTVTVLRTAAGDDGSTTVEHSEAVAAGRLASFDVGALADGGAIVEVTGGRATVAQRLVAGDRTDRVDCLGEASPNAYFASARTDEGSTAQLWITNPFPTDASVDLRISGDDGVRQPGPFRGLIIPARTSRLVDLATPGGAELRDQISIAVETRAGRIVTGLVQTMRGRGVATVTGVPRPATTWVVPYSFTGEKVSERIWIYNPTEEDASVLVSAMPQGVPADMLPEPFVRDIPARRYEVVDLAAEGRLPTNDLRWLQIDELNGGGVVVAHAVVLEGAAGDGADNSRPSIGGGVAVGSGTTVQATQWTVTSLDAASLGPSLVVLTNPSPETIAVATIERFARGGAEGSEPSELPDQLEIPPLGTLALNVSELADVAVGFHVSATSPIVVAARTVNDGAADFAMWTALPVLETVSAIPGIGG